MAFSPIKYTLVALLAIGSAILLFSCKSEEETQTEPLESIMTEQSEHLTIVMSENGRRSYQFVTPLLEGYTLGRDPYREFRKGIKITTYQDDSLSTVNATLVANYAIYYERRKLWEAKGNVVVTKSDGTKLYTQQLFWNSMTKKVYSNVDTKLETDTDTLIGEGFEANEDLSEPRFRRFKGRMQVDDVMTSQRDSTATSQPKQVADKPKQSQATPAKKSTVSEKPKPSAPTKTATTEPSTKPIPLVRKDAQKVEEKKMDDSRLSVSPSGIDNIK